MPRPLPAEASRALKWTLFPVRFAVGASTVNGMNAKAPVQQLVRVAVLRARTNYRTGGTV